MSGSGLKLAPHSTDTLLPKDRSPLAHLLHALNQPLTGLQCLLELAVAGPRRADDYVRTLRDGLELTGRMRVLVEAIRELVDSPPSDPQQIELMLLETLLHDAVDDLLPVAEARSVNLQLVSNVSLPVRASRSRLVTLMFRGLESALNLAQDGTDLQIVARSESGQACIAVSWIAGLPPEHSPFSRPELGLLIAQAGWENAGAEWKYTRRANEHTHTVRLPMATSLGQSSSADLEISK